MFKRKEMKKLAKKQLKKHYWIFVVACLLAVLWSVHSTITAGIARVVLTEGAGFTEISEIREFPSKLFEYEDKSAVSVFAKIAKGDIDNGRKISDEIFEKNKRSPDKNIKKVEMGYREGVFAHVANNISSGHIYVAFFSAIRSIVGSDSTATVIFIILSLIIIMTFWACIINVYKASYRRIFLEGYIYSKIPIRAFIRFIQLKRYFKATAAMLLTSGLKLLWWLTVVGGVVKYFSYFLVPYIVAENPDISPVKAIKLSESMMKGHKLECFRHRLSFISWDLLSIISFGIAGVFFLNPYKEAFFTGYYVFLRNTAKEKGTEHVELLNDDYLYQKAAPKTLSEVYSDVVGLSEKYETKNLPGNAVWRFFANIFGVVLTYSRLEQEYFDSNMRKEKIISFKTIIQGESYPGRLNPILQKYEEKKIELLNYRRHYSVCSLIVIFFLLSFTGWFWEMCIHLVEDGEFVNRGFLQGPWLPIYGFGGIMMLVFLNRLRANPIAEFTASIVLCGVVEYFTGLMLEMRFNEKWWDYNGYFLNIDGRVCAEGLLIFGIGGAAIVYFIAPLLDNALRKVRLRVLLPVCIGLVIICTADGIYSYFNPNIGRGITYYPVSVCEITDIN